MNRGTRWHTHRHFFTGVLIMDLKLYENNTHATAWMLDSFLVFLSEAAIAENRRRYSDVKQKIHYITIFDNVLFTL